MICYLIDKEVSRVKARLQGITSFARTVNKSLREENKIKSLDLRLHPQVKPFLRCRRYAWVAWTHTNFPSSALVRDLGSSELWVGFSMNDNAGTGESLLPEDGEEGLTRLDGWYASRCIGARGLAG
jgi:hypothetical protein